MRWWIPATLLAAAAAAIIGIRLRETPFVEHASLAILLLALLALGCWYVFLTGLPRKTRFILAGAGVLFLATLAFGIRALTRVDGSIGGSGLPRLAWKWTPPIDAAAGPLLLTNTPAAAAAHQPPAEITRESPQFLGPDRSGVIPGVIPARDWTASPPRELWRQPIGAGWSSFAVSAGQAITQEQREEYELTVAYDLVTGAARWAHTNRARFSEALGGVGPRATPTIRDGRVYAMGATGILDCLDEATGRLLWSRDVLRDHGLQNLSWGKSCSPLLVDSLVVVTGGEQREKSLLAYHAADGQPAWHSGRDRAAYASPILATLAGQPQIIIVNGHSVTGHRPEDGRLLWEYPWPGEFPKVAQPLPLGSNQLLVATGYGLSCALLELHPAAEGEWQVGELWKNRNLKPKFTNPVRRDQYVYGLDEGILVCLDPFTGERKWKAGRYGHGQILRIDDLLLIQAERGEVVLVEASPEAHRELARLPALNTKTWNVPVLAGDLLLVRNDREAACYQLTNHLERSP